MGLALLTEHGCGLESFSLLSNIFKLTPVLELVAGVIFNLQ